MTLTSKTRGTAGRAFVDRMASSPIKSPLGNRRSGRRWRCIPWLCLLGLLSAGRVAQAQTCTTQSKMPVAEREGLAAIGRSMTALALNGNAGAMKDASTADLQKDFNGVAVAVLGLHDSAQGSVTIAGEYVLDNTAAHPQEETAQFFCGAYTAEQRVTFTLPGLKSARYAVVFVHVTGTTNPRQLTYVLQDVNGWKLAGFVQKPLTQAGHDGVWYWQHGRELARKHELWNAALSLQIARLLVTPVGFVSSANLDKLIAEQQAVQPVDWPSDDRPLLLQVEGKSVAVIDVNPILSSRSNDVIAKVTYRAEKPTTRDAAQAEGAQTDVSEKDEAATASLQQAIGQEMQRKVQELQSFVTQLVVASNQDSQPTVITIQPHQ